MSVCAETIAHEFRNPLGAIKIALFNIKEKNKNPDLRNHIENIEQKISESDQLINTLLDYSQEKTPKYQTISVADILNRCTADCQNKYSDRNVSIQKEGDYARNNSIEADPEHIVKIFSNVITNMFQALPKNNGHITIDLDYKQEDGYCRIMFQDNGSGV